MSAQTISLEALRERTRAASADDLPRLEVLLRSDPRAGARALLASFERRLQRDSRETERLRALDALAASLRAAGARHVAGVDEVGMGPLAGPVVAAAVVLPPLAEIGDALAGLDDSKRLSVATRERLAAVIRRVACAVALAEVGPDEIDRLNVHRAGLEAMRRAVLALTSAPDHVLVDARTIPGIRSPQTARIRGDTTDAAIAAASILAKVHRDALMVRLDVEHPGYGFARHKGYPTEQHVAALRRLGPCPMHRRSFAPVTERT